MESGQNFMLDHHQDPVSIPLPLSALCFSHIKLIAKSLILTYYTEEHHQAHIEFAI